MKRLFVTFTSTSVNRFRVILEFSKSTSTMPTRLHLYRCCGRYRTEN